MVSVDCIAFAYADNFGEKAHCCFAKMNDADFHYYYGGKQNKTKAMELYFTDAIAEATAKYKETKDPLWKQQLEWLVTTKGFR